MKKCLLARILAAFSLLLLLSPAVPAQQLDHALGEVLVQLQPDADIRLLAAELQQFQHRNTLFRIRRQLNGPMNIWLCEFDYAKIHEVHLLERLRQHPMVLNAQFNHFLKLRSTIPDDPQFDKQWQYINTGQNGGTAGADLDMDLAWDITTGGVTNTGDTIVVCVIDNGLDFMHEDIGDNLWVNHGEIPDNGFDDDGNGYVDDFYGWNTSFRNDDIDVENLDRPHGTSVAGIIGARGNNGKGVTGLNWQVKLMIVVGGNGLESDALESYAYPLAQRRRYNETNGREGAFVVATNASWGVDYADPAEYPLWCSFYDTLGAAGILNIAATSNEDIDVEEEGDMPTSCSSDFLIGVTNLDSNGKKVPDAGYGAVSVDLGAFGEDVWTISRVNAYDRFEGTSAAAPHVAATVALLYAGPCPTLMAVAQSDPAAAALYVKDLILQGVTPESTLEGITTTGGRLAPFNSLQRLIDNCGDCPPPTSLDAVNVTDKRATLVWSANDSINKTDLRWRRVGSSDWQTVRNALSPFTLEGLRECSNYEFQLKTYCRNETLDYSPSYSFKTDGCCELPANFRLTSINDGSAVFQWQKVLAAEKYAVQLFKDGEADPIVISTAENIAFFNNLEPCTEYRARIQTVCAGGPTDPGPPIPIRTLGCGACLDLDYCVPQNIDGSNEWIAEVNINTLENASGPDGGYGDYTGTVTTELRAGESYPVQLLPGFSEDSYFEYFQVWIDLNHNGQFEPEEMVFDPGGASRKLVTGTISLPGDAELGLTRLRVVMKFLRPGEPCDFLGDEAFGEIEDYCVNIVEETGSCGIPESLTTADIAAGRVVLQWEAADDASEYLLRYRPIPLDGELQTEPWTLLKTARNSVTIDQLSECTDYEAQVKSVCNEILGLYSLNLSFRSSCTTTATPPSKDPKNELRVFPNPFRDVFSVQLNLPKAQSDLELSLYDSAGRPFRHQVLDLPAGRSTLAIPGADLPPGIYFLQLRHGTDQPLTEKVVKLR